MFQLYKFSGLKFQKFWIQFGVKICSCNNLGTFNSVDYCVNSRKRKLYGVNNNNFIIISLAGYQFLEIGKRYSFVWNICYLKQLFQKGIFTSHKIFQTKLQIAILIRNSHLESFVLSIVVFFSFTFNSEIYRIYWNEEVV